VDEEIQHALRRQIRQVAVGVVPGELADPAVIGHPRALREALELDEPGEVLIPRR